MLSIPSSRVIEIASRDSYGQEPDRTHKNCGGGTARSSAALVELTGNEKTLKDVCVDDGHKSTGSLSENHSYE